MLDRARGFSRAMFGCGARRLAGIVGCAINLKSEIYNLKSHRQARAIRPAEDSSSWTRRARRSATLDGGGDRASGCELKLKPSSNLHAAIRPEISTPSSLQPEIRVLKFNRKFNLKSAI
jgi:hypothetical protein